MAELKTTEKMEENRMYYGQEKAESTDAVLTKCGVENQVYHLTKYKREVEKYGILNEICKSIFPIDFLCVYYHDNPDMLDFIAKLREDVENKSENAKDTERIRPFDRSKGSYYY